MTRKDLTAKGFVHFVPGTQSARRLSFSMPDGRHIVTEAELNGQLAEVVLDSGASNTVLSTTMARQLQLRRLNDFTASGVTGRANGFRAEGITIKIGNVLIRSPQTAVFDFSAINATTGQSVAAVLGRDLFSAVAVDIDFSTNTLALYSPEERDLYPAATQLSLHESIQGLGEIPISVEGHPPIPAIFDLGSDTALYLSPKYAEQQGLLLKKRLSTSLSAGVEGNQLNRVAVLTSVTVGTTTLRNVPVEVPAVWDQPSKAFVGLPILRRFRLLVNFQKRKLGIIPDSKSVDQPFSKDRSGIGAIVSSDGLQIIHVAPNSPAALTGLKEGDVIVEINGRKVDAKYLSSRPREGTKPAGTRLDLTLKSGSKLQLILADYF